MSRWKDPENLFLFQVVNWCLSCPQARAALLQYLHAITVRVVHYLYSFSWRLDEDYCNVLLQVSCGVDKGAEVAALFMLHSRDQQQVFCQILSKVSICSSRPDLWSVLI